MCIHPTENFKRTHKMVDKDGSTVFELLTCQICGYVLWSGTLLAIMMDGNFNLSELTKIPVEEKSWTV